MKNLKFGAIALSALLVFSSCNMNNTTKGGLIGGGGGAVLGCIVGNLMGRNAGGTVLGAAIGGAIGTGAGVLIGKKMDKAKAAAQAVANAQVTDWTDANGLQGVKVTFDSGILFASGSSTLQQSAKNSLNQFANNVLKPNADIAVAIQGHTDNTGFKGVTSAEENASRNQALSLQRAQAVQYYLTSLGVTPTQIRTVEGLGQMAPIADNSTAAGKQQNRRVEVYLYASEAMINAANNGTLQ